MKLYVACGLLLSACAAQPYWYPDSSQCGTVNQVVDMDHDQLQKLWPTNQTVRYGAWVQPLGVILLSDKLTKDERECVLKHEQRHAECCGHQQWAKYRLECGESD